MATSPPYPTTGWLEGNEAKSEGSPAFPVCSPAVLQPLHQLLALSFAASVANDLSSEQKVAPVQEGRVGTQRGTL